jgi:hypothetical protein
MRSVATIPPCAGRPSGEVLTAHFFITKPLDLKWMFQLTDVERLMKQD